MLALILVATPHAAFGELVRTSLEDNGQYQVHLVHTARELRSSASRGSFQLAILDAALSDEPFVPLCLDLLQLQKGIRLIVIPPDNNPNHPSLGGLLPHSYLNRPFYLPDLVNTVTHLLNQQSSEVLEQKQTTTILPPWLVEPLVLQGYLEQELSKTQAKAGIIGLQGPALGSGTLRAYAGQLDDSTAQEVAAIVFRYWNCTEKTDLMRFVRVSTDNKDYLIYTTQLVGQLLLILVYDTTAPLSQIRPQTKNMAQRLTSHPPEGLTPAGGHPKVEPSTARPHNSVNITPKAGPFQPGQAAPITPDLPGNDEPTQPDLWETLFTASQTDGPQSQTDIFQSLRLVEPGEEESEPASLPITSEEDHQPLEDFNFLNRIHNTISPDPQDETGNQEGNLPEESFSLSELLGSIPSPDPAKEPATGGWLPESSASFPGQINPGALGTWKLQEEPDQKIQTEEISSPGPSTGQTIPAQVTASSMPEQSLSIKPPSFDLNLAIEEEIDSLEDTRPHIIATLTSLSQLEPPSPALSQINYTCVLIPRLPLHYLTGELADRLAFWVQQLCLAFGWRLEGIAIRPEYLQWKVQVSPSISPGNLVRIVRQRTSLQIFNQFSHLGDQNPSGDFWATGYLIVSGAQPPSAQLLRDYIAQTRKRQGIG